MKPHPNRRRPEPYFKVQIRDPITLAWRDERREAFATLPEAVSYLEHIGVRPVRIVKFEGGRSTAIHEQH
jgi:hypothetical protein